MKMNFYGIIFKIFFLLFLTPVYSQWERSEDIRESWSHTQIQKKDNALLLNSTSLDSFITATMSSYHIPGLSACILKEGELVWHNAYGYADVERKIPVTDSTLFDLASISKIITGTAIMQLYERGLLNLDDNVNNYLPPDLQVVNPYYPNIPITCRMILSGVSSIGWDWNFMGKYVVAGDSPIPLFDFLKNYFVPGGAYYRNRNYLSYPPGSTYDGSDHAGKALLGYLVEAITDTSFEEYCQKQIFAPLSMNETSWFLANLDTSHIARPYTWTPPIYKPSPHRGIPWYPNGLLRTSSLQLARYLNAFMQKGTLENIKILDSSTVALITKAHYPEIALPSGLIKMGLLWYQVYIGNRLVWGRWGSFDPGATTSMNYYEPEKSGVIVLTNQYGADGVVKIRSALFDYAVTIPTGILSSDENMLGGFALRQNYPNPFNQSTLIEYNLPKAAHIRLVIYDVLGRKIKTLMDAKQPAGNFQTSWNGTNEFSLPVATGVYLCLMDAGEFVKVTKLLLIK